MSLDLLAKIFVINKLEFRSFTTTIATPGGIEVNNDILALVAAETDYLSEGIGSRNLRSDGVERKFWKIFGMIGSKSVNVTFLNGSHYVAFSHIGLLATAGCKECKAEAGE